MDEELEKIINNFEDILDDLLKTLGKQIDYKDNLEHKMNTLILEYTDMCNSRASDLNYILDEFSDNLVELYNIAGYLREAIDNFWKVMERNGF